MVRRKALSILFLLFSGFAFGQDTTRVYDLTIAAYKHNGSIPKQVFLAMPYVAEAVDDFGFEIYCRSKYIKQHSVRLWQNDTLLLELKNTPGCRIAQKVLNLVKQSQHLLKIEIFDVLCKKPKVGLVAYPGALVYFIKQH